MIENSYIMFVMFVKSENTELSAQVNEVIEHDKLAVYPNPTGTQAALRLSLKI